MAKASTNVIKYVMSEKGVTRQQLATALNTSLPGISNKFVRGSFDWHDLTVVAAACGVRLAFVDDNNNVVITFPGPVEGQDKQKTE